MLKSLLTASVNLRVQDKLAPLHLNNDKKLCAQCTQRILEEVQVFESTCDTWENWQKTRESIESLQNLVHDVIHEEEAATPKVTEYLNSFSFIWEATASEYKVQRIILDVILESVHELYSALEDELFE